VAHLDHQNVFINSLSIIVEQHLDYCPSTVKVVASGKVELKKIN